MQGTQSDSANRQPAMKPHKSESPAITTAIPQSLGLPVPAKALTRRQLTTGIGGVQLLFPGASVPPAPAGPLAPSFPWGDPSPPYPPIPPWPPLEEAAPQIGIASCRERV